MEFLHHTEPWVTSMLKGAPQQWFNEPFCGLSEDDCEIEQIEGRTSLGSAKIFRVPLVASGAIIAGLAVDRPWDWDQLDRFEIYMNSDAHWTFPIDLLRELSTTVEGNPCTIMFPSGLLFQYMEQNLIPFCATRALSFKVTAKSRGVQIPYRVLVQYATSYGSMGNEKLLTIRQFRPCNIAACLESDMLTVPNDTFALPGVGFFFLAQNADDALVLRDNEMKITYNLGSHGIESVVRPQQLTERLFYVPLTNVEQWNSQEKLDYVISMRFINETQFAFGQTVKRVDIFLMTLNQLVVRMRLSGERISI